MVSGSCGVQAAKGVKFSQEMREIHPSWFVTPFLSLHVFDAGNQSS
jgi:hypothetical protein